MHLGDAVTTEEILRALTSFEWWEAHKTECLEEAIPSQGDLTDWWKESPSEAQAEADSLLMELFIYSSTSSAAWWRHTVEGEPALVAEVYTETKETVLFEDPFGINTRIEVGKGCHLEYAAIPDVHKRWLETPEGSRPGHPLGPIVRAWLSQSLMRQPNRRNDPILPVVQPVRLKSSVEVKTSLERKTAQLMLGLVPDGSEQKSMPLLPHHTELTDQAWRVPLLALADASGTPSRSYGRGAALDLRLVIETTLSVEPDDRELNAILLPFTVGELRMSLFPNGWKKARDWPRVREALCRAGERKIPIDGRHAWYPLAVRQLPSEPGVRLSDQIIIEVALPPGSKTGPVIDRQKLRRLGVESGPRYRTYIAIHSLAWQPGVTRIVNPTTKGRGWAGNPDAYPVVTVQDRRMLAFGPGDSKHYTREEINAAFTDVPDTVIIDRDAVDPKTGAKGWRVLPIEAANAVHGWLQYREQKLANRGKPDRQP